jgi:alanine racemase
MVDNNSKLETRDSKLGRGGRPTRALVDLGAVARNYRFLATRVAPAAVIPVVKADAYGHGAVPVARRLEAEGARVFAVAIAEEGVALRRAGIASEILILNFSDPADVPLHRAYGLTPGLFDLEHARAMAQATAELDPPLPVHLKLDTGMGRLGVQPAELGATIDILRKAKGLALAGVYSTLASSSDAAAPATGKQAAVVREGLAAIKSAGLAAGLVHLANSGGALAHPASWFDAVRPGLALYGVAPAELIDAGALEPAMTLETEIMSVRDVPAGTPLGYGGSFVTARPSRIALLPIGYDDGLRRSFSSRLSVLVKGEEAAIVGAVSMDLTIVDVTGIAAGRGERVVCLGRDGDRSVTAWDWARAAGAIPYEVLCSIGRRVPRVYLP